VLQDPLLTRASAGIHVVDLATGDEVFNHSGDVPFIPASTMKIVTTAVAARDARPGVRVLHARLSPRELAPDGVLDGDLYVKGSAIRRSRSSDSGGSSTTCRPGRRRGRRERRVRRRLLRRRLPRAGLDQEGRHRQRAHVLRAARRAVAQLQHGVHRRRARIGRRTARARRARHAGGGARVDNQVRTVVPAVAVGSASSARSTRRPTR
jgi:hypothetical protein